MSDFGGLQKHENTQNAQIELGSTTLLQRRFPRWKGSPDFPEIGQENMKTKKRKRWIDMSQTRLGTYLNGLPSCFQLRVEPKFFHMMQRRFSLQYLYSDLLRFLYYFQSLCDILWKKYEMVTCCLLQRPWPFNELTKMIVMGKAFTQELNLWDFEWV